MSEQDAKMRAAVIRERADAICPWTDSPAKEAWIIGYMTGQLWAAFEREFELESQLAAMTAERDGWKDTAECRKPNPTLLKL